LGDDPLIPRRKNQILAAGTFVRSGDTDIRYSAVPEIIDGPQHLEGDFNHQGTFLGIKPDEAVDRVVVVT
jgi:hypothetical protein